MKILVICSIIILIISVCIILFHRFIYNHKIKENEDNLKINKKYIKTKYGEKLIRGVMGQYDKNKYNYVFFINKLDAKDIKLPYELLSPIKTCEKNNSLFYLNIDSKYQCVQICDHRPNNDIVFGSSKQDYNYGYDDSKYYNYEFFKNNIFGHLPYIFTYGRDNEITYNEIKESQLKHSLIPLINRYDLDSKSFLDFYIALIKKKQPTLNEMYDILIKFEKAKREIKKLNRINKTDKLSIMLEDTEKAYPLNSEYNNIDKELLSLVKNK